MSSWVFTFRVEPPHSQTILARSGGSIFFAAWSRLLDRWYMIYPGGSERIEPPEMWLCEEDWAKTHQRDLAPAPVQRIRRSEKPEQMQLF
jgi:hypothetical protein